MNRRAVSGASLFVFAGTFVAFIDNLSKIAKKPFFLLLDFERCVIKSMAMWVYLFFDDSNDFKRPVGYLFFVCSTSLVMEVMNVPDYI